MNASNAVYRSLLDRKEWADYKDLDLSVSIPTCNEAGDIDLPRQPIQDAHSGTSFDSSSIDAMLAGDSTEVVESATRLFPNFHVQLNHVPAEQRAAGLSDTLVTGLTAGLSPRACGMNAGARREYSLNSVHGGEQLSAVPLGLGVSLHYGRLLRLIGPEYSPDPHYSAQASKEVRPARE